MIKGTCPEVMPVIRIVGWTRGKKEHAVAKFSVIANVLVLSLLVLAGCGDLPGKRSRVCYGDGICKEADGNYTFEDGATACHIGHNCTGDSSQSGDTAGTGDDTQPTPDCQNCVATAADSDGDCVEDLLEATYLARAQCAGLTNSRDTDGDGVFDGCENRNWDDERQGYEMDACNVDTDGDGIPDGLEDDNHNGRLDPGESSGIRTDTDFDGIPDGVEDANHDGKVDRWVDIDNDGCYSPGTDTPGESDPNSLDSDQDGIVDNVEDANHNGQCEVNETCLWVADTDCDGLRDGKEDKNGNGIINVGETNPLLADTDADGLADGCEDWNRNGAWEQSTETSALKTDSDNDGIADGAEDIDKDCMVDTWIDRCLPANTCATQCVSARIACEQACAGNATCLSACATTQATCSAVCETSCTAQTPYCQWAPGTCLPSAVGGTLGIFDPGIDLEGESDPRAWDSDGDNIGDGNEDANHNGECDIVLDNYISPRGQTLLCPNGNECPAGVICETGVCKDESFLETCTFITDTDSDGLADGLEDTNRDGRHGLGETNPRDPDSDRDGLLDGCPAWLTDRRQCEDQNNNGLLNIGETDPQDPDTDGDNLNDGCEVNFDPINCSTPGNCSTNPLNEDTDGDGYADAEEDANHNCVYNADAVPPEIDPRVFDPPPAAGTLERAKFNVCGTRNLKELTFAQSALPTHDYRLAFEVEKDEEGLSLPYIVSAYGKDIDGNGFSVSDNTDALWGHAFQSPEKIDDPIYGELNRDIYGFILATTTATDMPLDDILDSHVAPALAAAFPNDDLAQIQNVTARPAHDNIEHNDPQYTDFRINRAQRVFDLALNRNLSARVSAIKIRNQIISALVNRFDPGALAADALPAGLPTVDPNYSGNPACPNGLHCNFDYSLYVGAVRRLDRKVSQSDDDKLVEDTDGLPPVLFIVALTQNDKNDGTNNYRRWEDRTVRLEDLTGGSALGRFDAGRSSLCEEKFPQMAAADMLWVVDDSASMQSVIGRLQRAAEDTRAVLTTNREIVDFRVAMTTTNPAINMRTPCPGQCDASCADATGDWCEENCASEIFGCLKICPADCTVSNCTNGVCTCGTCSNGAVCSGTCLDRAAFVSRLLEDADVTDTNVNPRTWADAVPTGNSALYPLPGGGGTFYYEDSEYLDCLAAAGNTTQQRQDRFTNSCDGKTGFEAFFNSGNRLQLLGNAGMHGADPDANCADENSSATTSMSLMYDVDETSPIECNDSCERLTEECTDGPTILTSQMCDLIRSMGGLPCNITGGTTSGSRPHSAAESGSRSARRLLTKMIPALPKDYVGALELSHHLRLNCSMAGSGKECPTGLNAECDDHETCVDNAGHYECQPTGNCQPCDPRAPPLAASGASCTTDEECAVGEKCSGGHCYMDCRPVPLVTVFLSDEEDFYFKDECIIRRQLPPGLAAQWEVNARREADLSELPDLCYWNNGDPLALLTHCADFGVGEEADCNADADCEWDAAEVHCDPILAGQPCSQTYCESQGYDTDWPNGYDPDLAAQTDSSTTPTIKWRDGSGPHCSADLADVAVSCVGDPCRSVIDPTECGNWSPWCEWVGFDCVNRCTAHTWDAATTAVEWAGQRSACTSDPMCRWEQAKVGLGNQQEACVLKVQPNDCQACKRQRRTRDAIEGRDGLVGFSDIGPVYAIVRDKGVQGFVESSFSATVLGQDDCAGGQVTWGRGDGQAYRDLAIGTLGRTQNVCTRSETQCGALNQTTCTTTPGCNWDSTASTCRAVGYLPFLQLLITDIAALSAPYPLAGAPIAATIKVGVARPIPDVVDGYHYFEVPRSRTSGFFYNGTTNSLGFKSDPVDGSCEYDPDGGSCAVGDGINQAEIASAANAPHVPRRSSQDLVFVSYRYWLPVPCQERCGDDESCLRLFCPEESSMGVCDDDNDCTVIGERCLDLQCQVDCTPGESMEICRCGNCPACHVCDPDTNECVLATSDPCVCDPRHETCREQHTATDCEAMGTLNPDGLAYCTWDGEYCNLNRRCTQGSLEDCGPGFVCDESCTCVQSPDCPEGFGADGSIIDCDAAEQCCIEWGRAAAVCPTIATSGPCATANRCTWDSGANLGAGACIATADPCCLPDVACPNGASDCNPGQACNTGSTPALCEPSPEEPACWVNPETGVARMLCIDVPTCECNPACNPVTEYCCETCGCECRPVPP